MVSTCRAVIWRCESESSDPVAFPGGRALSAAARRGERPDREIEIGQLVDDLCRAPAHEFQADGGEHLLGHSGPPGVALVEGRVDVISW